MDNILKHSDLALELANEKIEELYQENMADEDAIDDEKLEELFQCIMIKSKIGKLRCLKMLMSNESGHAAHNAAAALKNMASAGL